MRRPSNIVMPKDVLSERKISLLNGKLVAYAVLCHFAGALPG